MHLTIRLNPVAMVEHLDDAVALQAARRMSSRTYIGYVDCLRDFPLPVKPYHKCSIQFVGQGLPTRLKDEFVERDMCVPIYPNTLHPLAREPLRAKPPSLFPDCYQYSFVTATVRVPNQNFDPKLAFWLSGKHVSEHHRLLSHDLYRRTVLKREKGVPGPDPASIILWERQSTRGPSPDLNRGPSTSDDEDGDADDDSIASKASFSRSEAASPVAHNVVPSASHPAAPSDAGHIVPFSGKLSGTSDFDHTQPLDVLYGPDDTSDNESELSMIESNSDSSSMDSIMDLAQLVFAPEPDEDPDIIPLVEVSLEIGKIEHILDPVSFLDEREAIIAVIKDSRARNAAAFAQDVYADTKSEVSPADLDAKDVLGKTMRPSRPPRRWHRGVSSHTTQFLRLGRKRVSNTFVRIVNVVRTHACLPSPTSSS